MNHTVDKVFNHYKQLLATKHNAKISKYNRVVVHALVKEKKMKLRCMLKECCLFYYCKEYLKRFYKGEECKRRIPKFAVYYKDYLKYFCKAMIRDLNMNKVLMKNMEKAAQVFYYHNYHKGNNVDKCNNNNNVNKNVDKKKVNCVNKVFFDKKVVNDIEKERSTNNNNNNNNTSNVFKKSNSSHNITSISKITSQNVNDDSHINDSLMNILLCTLQQQQQQPQQHSNININTTNQPPLSFPSITFKDNINIPPLLKNPLTSSFPSKQKLSFKTPINTPIPSSTQQPPQYKLTTNKKLKKVRQHPNNSGNSITNLTTTTTNNHNQHYPYNQLPQVVYQYQKYRFKSSDKTPIPPQITSLPTAITLSSPKHSIHLLSVSPPSTQNIHIHHKACSPPSTSNTNHTSYQRFIFQNNTNIINNNIIQQLSPICAKTKLNNIKINKFTTNKSKPNTRMQSFSLRNSIGIEENVGIVPTNYRIGNKGSYLYGSVTSLYKRDYKTTMMKVEHMKTNNIQEQHSKIYNTLRLNKYN